jgi:transcriptional regulator GlxA family with amidase domain
MVVKQTPSDAMATQGRLVVDIVWEPGCLGGPALAAADVLRLVNAVAVVQSPTREPPLRWRWVQADGRSVPPSIRRCLPSCDESGRSRSAAEAGARVIVVPGWPARDGPEVDQCVARSRALLPRLRQTVEEGGAVLGVYTGVALLAAAGCLQGRRATAPWPFLAAVLRQAPVATDADGPPIQWTDAPGWTCDRGVWTCASPVALTEALLDLIGRTTLAPLAQAARDVVLPSAMRQGAAMAHARSAGAGLASSRVPAGIVERARQWLVEHLAEPYDIEALARAAATSPRTLARHFEATHGMSPHRYLERMRVERACLLLQTTYLTAEEIGRASGLPHPTTFRRVFIRHTGERPGDYRRRYRLRTQRPRWGSDTAVQAPARPARRMPGPAAASQ